MVQLRTHALYDFGFFPAASLTQQQTTAGGSCKQRVLRSSVGKRPGTVVQVLYEAPAHSCHALNIIIKLCN